MLKKQKSQATIYMTLGVVLMSVFGLMYLVTYQAKTTLKSQVGEVDDISVQNYV
jgi:hypothetical protein